LKTIDEWFLEMTDYLMNHLCILKLVSTLYFVCFIFNSCTWVEHDVNDDSGKVKLLKTIVVVNHGEPNPRFSPAEYEYDTQNRIIKLTIMEDDDPCTKFTYNSAGDLIKVDLDDGSKATILTTSTYSRNGNIITQTQEWFLISDGSSLLKATYTFELNKDDLPVKYSSSFNDDIYFYEYQNGNLVKSTRRNGNNILSTLTYTYDNKKTPFFHCKSPKWFLGSQKNNLTSQITDDGSSRNKVEYVYTYDDDGFPVSVTMKNDSGNGGASTATFLYVAK
jgi:hypothetical protein